MIKKSAYALYRLAQLDKVRHLVSRKPKLEKPSWITEQAFANSCNYEYKEEVDQATAEFLESCKDLPTARNFR